MEFTTHIIYAYYEKNEDYKTNLIYFLKYGYLEQITYTIVINGQCTVTLPQRDNITVIYRENIGFDFQGYYTGIMSLKNRGLLKLDNHYIFINCTVRGPFLQVFTQEYFKWYQPYLNLFKDNIKLVGSTISCLPKPHVQSYLFVTDFQGVEFLLSKEFFKVYNTLQEIITHQEIAMSQLFLSNGWNISCLVPEYQNVDYVNFGTRKDVGIVGHALCPHEVIFAKSNWGDPTGQVNTLSRRLMTPIMTDQQETWDCVKIKYGSSKKKSSDVTHILQFKAIDFKTLRPNKLFGDPAPGKRKKLFFYVIGMKQPIVMSESCDHIVCENLFYRFENMRLIAIRQVLR
jgi:hypothetical protein